MSQLYLRTRKQEELSRITYTFKIIQSLDRKAIDREVVLVIVLFDDPSNNFNFIDRVDFVEMLCFSINVKSIKQYMNLKFMRAQNLICRPVIM